MGVIDAMEKTAHVLMSNFNCGGYLGGRWASAHLVEGPKPPEFPDFDVTLKRFVMGHDYNPRSNVFDPVSLAIHALPL